MILFFTKIPFMNGITLKKNSFFFYVFSYKLYAQIGCSWCKLTKILPIVIKSITIFQGTMSLNITFETFQILIDIFGINSLKERIPKTHLLKV